MAFTSDTHAVCRGCGRILRGEPYYRGKPAFDPITGKQCPTNYYGGYVCSESCDRRACLELEGDMPGHAGQTKIGQAASAQIALNWNRS